MFEKNNSFENIFFNDENSFYSNNLGNEYINFDFEIKSIKNEEEEINDERYIIPNYSIPISFNQNKSINQENINLKNNLYKNIKSNDKTGDTTQIDLIFQITKKSKIEIILGRKRKNSNKGKHTKFSYDNLTRKLKSKLFESILLFLNSSFTKVQIENPRKYSKKILYSKPFFLKINQDIIKDINVDKNKELLNSKLKEIFSNDISKKMENFGADYNRKIIEKIYKEQIQTKTISILEKTLLECLEYFRGSKYYEELAGFEKEYPIVIKSLIDNGETEEYINIFKELLSRFDIYYENKKSRKKKVV